MNAGVVVVGAGHAGTTCAVAAREAGYIGPVTLVGDDPGGTYERPPLSKGFLYGSAPDSELNRRGTTELAQRGVDFVVGDRVERIERARRRVLLASGGALEYDRLVLATGGTPRVPPIPGVDSDGVVALRTYDDALRLRDRLGAARNLVIVGGGFIGLEVAAAARRLGVGVDVVEIRSRLLKRSTSAVVARHLQDLHVSQGVTFHFASTVERILADESGAVRSVLTSTGTTLAADAVVVGAGVRPATTVAEDAGLLVDDGIVVDQSLRTSDPAIYAIGDVARFPVGAREVRVESVQNALDQARNVGRQIAGGDSATYAETPWFWTEQYDVKLQIAGQADIIDEVHVIPRHDTTGFSTYCFTGGVLTVVESVNAAPDHIRARRLLATRSTTAREMVDNKFDVQEILRRS